MLNSVCWLLLPWNFLCIRQLLICHLLSLLFYFCCNKSIFFVLCFLELHLVLTSLIWSLIELLDVDMDFKLVSIYQGDCMNADIGRHSMIWHQYSVLVHCIQMNFFKILLQKTIYISAWLNVICSIPSSIGFYLAEYSFLQLFFKTYWFKLIRELPIVYKLKKLKCWRVLKLRPVALLIIVMSFFNS